MYDDYYHSTELSLISNVILTSESKQNVLAFIDMLTAFKELKGEGLALVKEDLGDACEAQIQVQLGPAYVTLNLSGFPLKLCYCVGFISNYLLLSSLEGGSQHKSSQLKCGP